MYQCPFDFWWYQLSFAYLYSYHHTVEYILPFVTSRYFWHFTSIISGKQDIKIFVTLLSPHTLF